MESPVAGRVQSALYAFAGMAYLLMSVLAIRFLAPEFKGANLQMMGYGASCFVGYLMITLLLFGGLVFSIRGKLTPKKTGVCGRVWLYKMWCISWSLP